LRASASTTTVTVERKVMVLLRSLSSSLAETNSRKRKIITIGLRN
jgi:hypothetical protein